VSLLEPVFLWVVIFVRVRLLTASRNIPRPRVKGTTLGSALAAVVIVSCVTEPLWPGSLLVANSKSFGFHAWASLNSALAGSLPGCFCRYITYIYVSRCIITFTSVKFMCHLQEDSAYSCVSVWIIVGLMCRYSIHLPSKGLLELSYTSLWWMQSTSCLLLEETHGICVICLDSEKMWEEDKYLVSGSVLGDCSIKWTNESKCSNEKFVNIMFFSVFNIDWI